MNKINLVINTKEPVMYSKTGLELLKTYNSDQIKSSVDIMGGIVSSRGLSRIMSNSDLSGITEFIGERAALAWNDAMLDSFASSKPNINTLYFLKGNYPLSPDALDSIDRLVNEYHIKVEIKHVTISLIATAGQYEYQSRLDYEAEGLWGIGVAADNHDLYKEHLWDSAQLANFFLIVPHAAPRIANEMSLEVSRQSSEDSRRYLDWRQSMINHRNNKTKLGDIANLYPVGVAMVAVHG